MKANKFKLLLAATSCAALLAGVAAGDAQASKFNRYAGGGADSNSSAPRRTSQPVSTYNAGGGLSPSFNSGNVTNTVPAAHFSSAPRLHQGIAVPASSRTPQVGQGYSAGENANSSAPRRTISSVTNPSTLTPSSVSRDSVSPSRTARPARPARPTRTARPTRSAAPTRSTRRGPTIPLKQMQDMVSATGRALGFHCRDEEGFYSGVSRAGQEITDLRAEVAGLRAYSDAISNTIGFYGSADEVEGYFHSFVQQAIADRLDAVIYTLCEDDTLDDGEANSVDYEGIESFARSLVNIVENRVEKVADPFNMDNSDQNQFVQQPGAGNNQQLGHMDPAPVQQPNQQPEPGAGNNQQLGHMDPAPVQQPGAGNNQQPEPGEGNNQQPEPGEGNNQQPEPGEGNNQQLGHMDPAPVQQPEPGEGNNQ
ncbi:MAG: hypothetical protein ABFQ95_00480 [Pseudomonadota bacterium]